METETRTQNGKRTVTSLPESAGRSDESLRLLAIQHLERVRKLKHNTAVFAIGIVAIGSVWAITEYQNAGGWPERLSTGGNPGDWNPWILWVVLGWGFLLALDALKTYFHRPTTEAEIERELARLKARS